MTDYQIGDRVWIDRTVVPAIGPVRAVASDAATLKCGVPGCPGYWVVAFPNGDEGVASDSMMRPA